MAFVCACCGTDLGDVPSVWAFSAPDYWEAPEAGDESFLEEELCCIDAPELEERHFFIRGLIEIPVDGFSDHLTYNVWVSLSPANFARAIERWDDPERATEQPYFGWLSNNIPGYPDTLQLKTRVHTREPGRRPFVELEPTDHPLAVEQRDGIAPHRLVEVAKVCGG
ncbi:DUF2199 domain-containing protein [Dactylosporangium sp. AC04546]|uniref:DUF2199 domain-containing protein n=1 Tax=Dactylosporangium sp. AC04546 TaxID=2862460 RepID=UPI001EE0951F|nr:DUF2199 domain-containing protein [Dactylosporangium sp. AC04546]WVK82185.1 DUF2199 domain-containing protein [Dactylosporangium sp. AC04546]